MKYKLKRDLPFAKAGSVILYSENRKEFDGSLGSVSDMMSVETDKGYLSQWVEIGAKDNLLSEGWIEEVKPREWYEVEVQTHNGDWVNWSTRFGDEQRARDAACNWAGNARFIKVREVIE